MGVLHLIACILLVIGAVKCQEYQEYEQRAAPTRLRPGNGPVEPRPTPVPILKQINRHNEDGSYTYGYEGADGSFKIETKLATGEVKGKYGYVDQSGKVRIVEYGANKYGFQPSGEGITVAPPTLVDESTNKDGSQILDYEEEQRPVQQQKPYIARVPRPQPAPRPQPQPRPQFIDYEDEPAPRPQYAPSPRPQYAPAPRPKYAPAPEPSRPRYTQGPAPPRLQIPGAQPVDDIIYSAQPRPARPDPEYTQSQTFAAPQTQSSPVRISRPSFALAPEPAPVARAQSFAPQQRPAHESLSFASPQPTSQYSSSPHLPQGRSGGVLDQLAKDYALPQGGAQALHDISFGYY